MKYFRNLKRYLLDRDIGKSMVVVALISLAVFTLSHILMAFVNLGTLDVVGLRVWLCLAILYGILNVIANFALYAFLVCTILWITIYISCKVHEHKKRH